MTDPRPWFVRRIEHASLTSFEVKRRKKLRQDRWLQFYWRLAAPIFLLRLRIPYKYWRLEYPMVAAFPELEARVDLIRVTGLSVLDKRWCPFLVGEHEHTVYPMTTTRINERVKNSRELASQLQAWNEKILEDWQYQ